jgi:hypothetical protein
MSNVYLDRQPCNDCGIIYHCDFMCQVYVEEKGRHVFICFDCTDDRLKMMEANE